MNLVALMGNLTRDPETRIAESGTSVTKFSIAVNEFRRKGEESVASFFDCVAFGKTSELIQTYFTKGKPIAVTGRLKQDRWNA